MSQNKANERQVGGSHYASAIQHWDLAAIYEWDYFTARAIAYLMRWPKKGGIQDLEKAVHFIQKKIEIEKSEEAGTLERDILLGALEMLDRERAETVQEYENARAMDDIFNSSESVSTEDEISLPKEVADGLRLGGETPHDIEIAREVASYGPSA